MKKHITYIFCSPRIIRRNWLDPDGINGLIIR
jgi:hypothetical protein